jgi:peptide/nickel transport system substrate-binding protein
VVAACGGDDTADDPPADDSDATAGSDEDEDGGETGESMSEPWIHGTTDTVSSLDPAGMYDLGSSTVAYALYQTVLTIPSGGNTPVGDAAESCEYTDETTLTCTLREGQTFSNGNALTSSDVKFSFDRNVGIADPNGAGAYLLANLASVDAPDDTTVVFNLNQPDATFEYVITYTAFGIVDEEVFPENEILASEQVVGSGPYALDDYVHGTSASLVKNENYVGEREAAAPQVLIQYYDETANLKLAVEQGDVQVAWRSLSPTEVNDLKSNDAVNVVEGEGAEIRYFVWQLGTDIGAQMPIRQAVAQIIDRAAIAERAYDGTVDPLYSMVPPGFAGQVDAFQETYGEPNAEAAEQILTDAGIDTPVELTLGYTPSHYGPNAVDEATELQRQLEDTGLFSITLESAEWEEYQDLYKQNAYDLFHLGWFPDFLDADNYLTPFLLEGGFYVNNYNNPAVNDLLAQEMGSQDQAEREGIFGELQGISAEEVPTIPSWVGKNVAITAPGIENIETSLDPAYIFRFWEITYNPE